MTWVDPKKASVKSAITMWAQNTDSELRPSSSSGQGRGRTRRNQGPADTSSTNTLAKFRARSGPSDHLSSNWPTAGTPGIGSWPTMWRHSSMPSAYSAAGTSSHHGKRGNGCCRAPSHRPATHSACHANQWKAPMSL
ncbi:hypothetical protein FQZ97_927670 [compost metagenome]